MQITLVSTIEHWNSIASCWNRLASGNPFCQWEWLSTWWKHYGTNRELCVLAVQDDQGSLIGVAPWYVERIASFGRVVRHLGSGEVCSEYVRVLCSREQEDRVTCALVAWLSGGFGSLRNNHFAWDLMALESVAVSDTTTAKLVAHFAESGCSIQNMPKTNCWRITLPETWPAYLSLLSKSHRKQINHLIRDLWDTRRARLWVARDETELCRGMKILEDLHQRRWTSAGRPGVFAADRFRGFLHDVAPRLLPTNVLCLAVLELDGRPAAVDFHLVTSETNYVYQGGLEPELAYASPGRLLTALLIREAIACGRKHLDFLRGDEPYKPHFRAEPTLTHDIHVVSHRTSSQIRHRLWRTGMTMKCLFKSGMSLAGMH